MSEKPLLSVVMITYGHEKYVEEAIKGVQMQKTNFPFEFIIANDCSPDNSDEVIKKAIKNIPENITVKYTRHKQNLGMMPNFIWALNQAQGKYIAYFEGDDYWSDSEKLQLQVDFLEKNQDFSIICHHLDMLENGEFEKENYIDRKMPKEASTIEDLAQHNFIATLTAVFRNQREILPPWIADSPIGDLPMFVKAAELGKIKFINRKMAVYRRNVGVWNSMKTTLNYKMIWLYDRLIEDYYNNMVLTQNFSAARSYYVKNILASKESKISEIFKGSLSSKISLSDKIKTAARKIFTR